MNGSTARRAAALVLLTLVLDPPITDWPRFVAWMAGFLAVFAAPPPKSWRRIGLAALVCLTALIGRHALPALHIEEAHNYFLPGPADAVRDWLPPPVLSALEEQFRERYPAEYWCSPDTDGCWRIFAPLTRPFAFSADAAFRERQYSRVVSTIRFRGLGDLRAGFTNRSETNWWDRSSDVRRRDMPFYVMYLLPAEAAGSVLCWRGDVFWERAGALEDVRSAGETCRTIETADAGARVFGISVLHQPLAMRLAPAPRLARSAVAGQALAILGAVAVAGLILVPPPRRLLLAFALVTVAAVSSGADVVAAFGRYEPIQGGGDGLTFEAYAHSMLESAERGHLIEVLKAVEPSFYFQPGMRYFRVLEKVLFGETNLGYLAVILLIPAVLLRFLRVFLPLSLAVVLWCLFFLPLAATERFWWDVRSYLDLARAGLAEPLAHTLWFCGAALLLRNATSRATGACRAAAWGSFAMSLACVARQNLLISSGLVLLLVGLELWRSSGWRTAWPVWSAFAPFLWIPIHNLVFAGRLELAAQMGPAHLTPPGVYLQAVRDLLVNDAGGAAWPRVAAHTALWIDSPARAAALALSLAGLLLGRLPLAHRGLILAVVGQLPVLLFWTPQGRYSHIAWQIILVSAVAHVVWLGQRAAARARPMVPDRLARLGQGGLTPSKVGMLVASLVVALAVLEVGCRMAASRREPPDVVVPGERAHFFTRPNSLGFRGPELHRRPECLGLVTLGGGATESARLADRESWPGRLQSELAGAFRCVQVTNAGREGFSTFGVGRLLDGLVLAAKPDGILLMTGHDDVARERATPAERAPLWPRRLRHLLGRHSALGSAVLSRPAERRYAVPTRMPAELAALPGASVDRREAQVALVRHRQTYVPAYRERLEEIVVRARERGVEPILLTQPALYGDAVDPATQVDLRSVRVDAAGGIHGGLAWRILELYNDAVRDLGREHRVQVVDLARRLPKDSRLYADFVNPSRDGAARAAEIVASGVCSSLALRFPRQVKDRCPVGPGT